MGYCFLFGVLSADLRAKTTGGEISAKIANLDNGQHSSANLQSTSRAEAADRVEGSIDLSSAAELMQLSEQVAILDASRRSDTLWFFDNHESIFLIKEIKDNNPTNIRRDSILLIKQIKESIFGIAEITESILRIPQIKTANLQSYAKPKKTKTVSNRLTLTALLLRYRIQHSHTASTLLALCNMRLRNEY
ncbi:MAG: hypothetical protein AB2764_11530 [Candidatus Thiodiazotropha endolucinida]